MLRAANFAGSTLFVLALASSPAEAVGLAPVAHWTGDGTTTDSSGNGHTGTIVGGVSFAPGYFGSAFLFDGTGAFVVPDAPDLNFGVGDFSFTFRFNANATTNAGTGFISKDSYPAASPYSGWLANVCATCGGLGAEIRDGGSDGQARAPSALFNTGTWHNLTFVRSSGTDSAYIDGVLIASFLESTAIDVSNASPVTIGALNAWAGDPNGDQNFRGLLDDIAIFNRALTLTEISQISSSGVAARGAAAGTSAAETSSSPSETRVALVIGNSAYEAVPALPNPHRDAETVADMLRRVGFQTVTLVDDLDREEFIETLHAFARQAESADWAVIYYAGHGLEMGGSNYLIPVDAKLVTDRDVGFEAISLDQVMGAVEGSRKLRVVILDACRNNPFASQMRRTTASRAIGRGLARVEPDSSGTLVVYAAKEGETALDGEGGNSPFVAALVQRLPTPGIEINKLFRLVRDDVLKATGNQQEPFVYGSLPGEDFFFASE